jgi:hypothetical protein
MILTQSLSAAREWWRDPGHSPLSGQNPTCFDTIAEWKGKGLVYLHEFAVNGDATWDWKDLTWLVTRAIDGGPYILLGLSAIAAGSACTLGASCHIWTENINQSGAIRHKKLGRVKVLRHMIHTIPDSIDYQLWLQNPRDPRLQRLIAEALRDQGKMHDIKLKAVRGEAVLCNTAVEIPAHVISEIMVKFRKAVTPDQHPTAISL